MNEYVMNATRLAYEDDELGVVYRVMAAVVLIDAISYLFHSFFFPQAMVWLKVRVFERNKLKKK